LIENQRQSDGVGQAGLALVTGEELAAVQLLGCGNVENIFDLVPRSAGCGSHSFDIRMAVMTSSNRARHAFLRPPVGELGNVLTHALGVMLSLAGGA